ncbi:MAG: OmpA family protein [Candidatus Kapaibacteriales bacterium]
MILKQKSFIIVTSAAISCLLLSCVSKSTHEAALGRIDSLENVNSSLRKNLYEREADIAGLDSELAELKRKNSQLEAELLSARELYEQAKSSAGATTQKMLADIERLQKEKIALQRETDRIQSLLKQRDDKLNGLMQRLKQSLLGFEGSGLSLEIKKGRVYVSLSNQLLFASGSTDINAKGKEALTNLATVLNDIPDINVLVEGHTDDKAVRGGYRFTDNWELSVLRATEVTKFLSEEGEVAPQRIIASGRSEYMPLDPSDTDQARSINRRTEIILTPDLGEIYEILKTE